MGVLVYRGCYCYSWCLVRLFVNNEDNNDNDSNNDIIKTKPLKHSASFSLQGSSVSQ